MVCHNTRTTAVSPIIVTVSIIGLVIAEPVSNQCTITTIWKANVINSCLILWQTNKDSAIKLNYRNYVFFLYSIYLHEKFYQYKSWKSKNVSPLYCISFQSWMGLIFLFLTFLLIQLDDGGDYNIFFHI